MQMHASNVPWSCPRAIAVCDRLCLGKEYDPPTEIVSSANPSTLRWRKCLSLQTQFQRKFRCLRFAASPAALNAAMPDYGVLASGGDEPYRLNPRTTLHLAVMGECDQFVIN